MSELARKTLKTLDLLRVPRFRRALLHGVAAALEHRALRELSPVVVVDVGANKGQFTLLALEIFPLARIIAFEPLVGPGNRFRRAIGNDPRVRLIAAALGSNTADVSMNVAGRDDCSSLLPVAKLAELHPDARMVGMESVKVGRLQDFVNPEELAGPALLKIDVQGFELEVLRGCGDWLNRFTWVYVECSFCELYADQALADAVFRMVMTAGFELSGVYCLSCDADGTPLQADVLFTRRS